MGSVGSTRPGDVRKRKGNRVREEKRRKRIVVGKASTKEGRRGAKVPGDHDLMLLRSHRAQKMVSSFLV